MPVPAHHRTAPNLLSAVGGIGTLIVAWGVIALDAWPTLVGAALVYAGRLLFLDRMVWLWHDTRGATEGSRLRQPSRTEDGGDPVGRP